MVGDFFVSLGFVLHVQSCLHIFFPVTSRAVGKKKRKLILTCSLMLPQSDTLKHTHIHTHTNPVRILPDSYWKLYRQYQVLLYFSSLQTWNPPGLTLGLRNTCWHTMFDQQQNQRLDLLLLGTNVFLQLLGKVRLRKLATQDGQNTRGKTAKSEKKTPNWYRMGCRGTHWECICPRETDTHLPGCDLLSTQIKYPSLKS